MGAGTFVIGAGDGLRFFFKEEAGVEVLRGRLGLEVFLKKKEETEVKGPIKKMLNWKYLKVGFRREENCLLKTS